MPEDAGDPLRARDLAARIYDKTAEVQRRGVSWLPDLWGTEGSDPPVWRLEFHGRADGEFLTVWKPGQQDRPGPPSAGR